MKQRIKVWWFEFMTCHAPTFRMWAWWVLGNVTAPENEIDEALKAAFKEAGLGQHLYSADFDLLHSGKLHEVLVHAAAKLGNPLVTVSDVKELLG